MHPRGTNNLHEAAGLQPDVMQGKLADIQRIGRTNFHKRLQHNTQYKAAAVLVMLLPMNCLDAAASSPPPHLIVLFEQTPQHGIALGCCICWCGRSALHNYVGELLAPSAAHSSSVLLQFLNKSVAMLLFDIWISLDQYHKVPKYV
jgi:hypothetical protein